MGEFCSMRIITNKAVKNKLRCKKKKKETELWNYEELGIN